MMLTRCPSCETAYRVTTEQLRARGGRVRCGRCMAVFNAVKTLRDAAPALEGATMFLSPEKEINMDMPPARRPAVFAWGLVFFLALAVLLGQTFYVFRADIARLYPGWRPQLEALCQQIGCEIALPRKIALVDLESSDLNPDAQRKPLLTLTAALRNRAPFAQAYPHLELTLTAPDAYGNDQPVIRKVFAPQEYLPESVNMRAGFPAQGNMAVTLLLDPGDARVSGYRLYLFYP